MVRKYAERSAASITPPVAPKITPAPEPLPSGSSNGDICQLLHINVLGAHDTGKFSRRQHQIHITARAADCMPGSSRSAFFAMQGMIEIL